jgi:hypothetical protein
VRSHRRVVVTLGVAVLVAVLAFLAWEEGVPAYQRSQQVAPVTAGESLALPEQVYDPPLYTPSTQKWGPPGPLSLVFQGRVAREGFTGEVARPWIGVSARSGDYVRLEAPHLAEARGRLSLHPSGTAVAWTWPGGVATYDSMTGRATTHEVPGADASTPLAWSPRSRVLAVGTDPVRVLDPSSGDVTALPLRGASAGVPPAWTPDGRWVTLATRAGVTLASADGAGVRRFRGRVGAVAEPAWGDGDEMAGAHLIPDPRQVVVRLVRMVPPGADSGRAVVRDASPDGIVIDRVLGWAGEDSAVLAGLRPETGQIEQAVVASLSDGVITPYLEFPTLGDNWVGVDTVSVAADLLREPTEPFESPTLPWAPVAKLLLCLLLAVFPAVYYLIARRPRA